MRIEIHESRRAVDRDQRRYLRGTLRWALRHADTPFLRVEANIDARESRTECELRGFDATGLCIPARGSGATFTEAVEMAANALSIAAFSAQRGADPSRRAA